MNLHYADGKRRQLSCESKKHAEQRLADLLRSPEDSPRAYRQTDYTVGQAMSYLEKHFAGMASERTSLLYASEVAEFFGHSTPVDEITANDRDKLIAYLRRKDNSASTIRNKLYKLNLMREAAIKEGGVRSLPPLTKLRLKSNNIQKRIWSTEELRLVHENLTRRNRHQEAALLVFLVEMGPRFIECQRILGRHVDLKRGMVEFFKVKKDNKEGNRLLPMTPSAIEAIKPYLPLAPSGRVWSLQYKAFSDQIKKSLELCGIDDMPRAIHQLRHTCGTRLGMQGKSAFEIAAWLGHGNTSTCERYVHMDSRRLSGCYEALVATGSSW